MLRNNVTAAINEQEKDQVAVSIPYRDLTLHGHLYIPEQPQAIVVISHGTGSSRFSAKNNYVARTLSNNNIAALLVDVLTPKEDSVIENWFRIPLLTKRLKHATKWIMQYPGLENLGVAYFGVSTGAASALTAATEMEDDIRAVVCSSGRTDLVKNTILSCVACPTLLVVGGLDSEVFKIATKTFQHLACKKKVVVVNSASHSFKEPGKLHIVTELASDWFEKYVTW